MGALTDTLPAIPSCTTDDWLPPALFWSPLPCLVILLSSLAWVICSLGESGTATSKGLGDMDDDALCQGLDIGVLSVFLTGAVGGQWSNRGRVGSSRRSPSGWPGLFATGIKSSPSSVTAITATGGGRTPAGVGERLSGSCAIVPPWSTGGEGWGSSGTVDSLCLIFVSQPATVSLSSIC